jgi:hypothetical protein
MQCGAYQCTNTQDGNTVWYQCRGDCIQVVCVDCQMSFRCACYSNAGCPPQYDPVIPNLRIFSDKNTVRSWCDACSCYKFNRFMHKCGNHECRQHICTECFKIATSCSCGCSTSLFHKAEDSMPHAPIYTPPPQPDARAQVLSHWKSFEEMKQTDERQERMAKLMARAGKKCHCCSRVSLRLKTMQKCTACFRQTCFACYAPCAKCYARSEVCSSCELLVDVVCKNCSQI